MYQFLPLLLLLLSPMLPASVDDPALRARQAEALLKQSPENPQALFQAAVALQQLQHLDRAEGYYRRLIELQPKWPEPRNNLAIILLKKGDYDGAIDLLISSLQTHPAYETAWRNLGNLYKGLASEAYRRALSEDKNPRSVLDRIRLQPLTRLTSPVETPKLPQMAQASTPPAPAAKTEPTAEPVRPAVPAPLQPVARPASSSVAKTAPKPAPVAATARPATPATSGKRDIQDLSQRIQQIRQAVLDWADAWTRKDLDRYLAAYAPDYRDGKPSHQAWVDWRRQRILRPGEIRVSISDIRLRHHDPKKARVDFVQAYRSPRYRDRVVKRLDLARIGGSWRIVREKTLRVLQSP